LDQHKERPVLDHAFVDQDLLEKIISFPVPGFMLDQIQSAGAVGYKTFNDPNFQGTQYNNKHQPINLYQAQHGALYYRLVLPITKYLDARNADFLDIIYILKFLNLVFITISLASLLWLLNRIVAQKSHAAMIALLIFSLPLLVINACRIANDPFAIMTGTFVVIIGILPQFRRRIVFSFLVGILIGISCWTKSTATVLFPFWICCIFLSYYKKEITFKQATIFLLVSNLIAIAILSQYFIFNIRNYGMLFVMQEAIVNRSNNISAFDMLSIAGLPAVQDIIFMWFKDTIWKGGWSLLKVSDISNISFVLISFSLLSWIYNIIFKIKRKGSLLPDASLICFSIVFFTSLALGWHYVQSKVAWGYPTTCAWYTCLSLPMFLMFVYDSASRWSTRTGFVIASLLISLYLYADIRGILSMLSLYSGGNTGYEALERISLIHPLWLSTPILLVCLLIFLCLVSVSLMTVVRTNRHIFITDKNMAKP